MAQLVKNPPAMWETWVRFLGWEDPLEKGKATHPSVLAWRIPWAVIVCEVAKSQTRLSDSHLHSLPLQVSVQFSSVAQSRPTLCDSMDYTVHGIIQTRILEWVAFPFSRGSS